MGFGSPIWLFGLLPWAALVMAMLPGRGTPIQVPFLVLWGRAATTARRWGRRPPSLAVWCALLALLLTILGAAQPELSGRGIAGGELCIVLDRGATMALPSDSGSVFRGVISRVPVIAADAKVTLIPVPGEAVTTRGDVWAAAAAAMTPTALRVQLDQVVTGQLRKTSGPVLVLSDQQLNLTDQRIVQIEPEPVGEVVAITAVGARLQPHPQVMIRLETRSTLTEIPLLVQSGKATIRITAGQKGVGPRFDRTLFVDLPTLESTVTARIELPWQKHPWEAAYLVRASNGIRLAVDPAMDEPIRRIAWTYCNHRLAGADARPVLISSHEFTPDQAGIWIATNPVQAARVRPTVVAHPVTASVSDWPDAADAAMPAGFAPVVSAGDRIIAAVRSDPSRQVWINADLRDWEKTPDFVVFFANALDWIAGQDQSYQSTSSANLGHDWETLVSFGAPPGVTAGEWPGIFRQTGGKMMAVNAGDLPDSAKPGTEVAAVSHLSSVAQTTCFSSEFYLLALLCLLAACVAWR